MKLLIKTKGVSPFMFHVMICGIIFFGIALYHWYFPVSYNYFLTEDSWAEYGTFASYLLAGILMIGAIKNDHNLRRPGYILFCLGLFFIAMEEVSWGQRIFGLHTPYIIAKNNYQSELNLHNLSAIPTRTVLNWGILIWAVLLPMIAQKTQPIRDLLSKVGVPLVSRELIPYFILGLLLSIENFRIFAASGEVAEFIFGLLFVFFVSEVYYKVYRNIHPAGMARGHYFLTLILVLVSTTFLLIKVTPVDANARRGRLLTSATGSYLEMGHHEQIKKIYEHIRHNKELRTGEILFQYGLFLKEKRSGDAGIVLEEALHETKAEMLVSPEKPGPNILAGKIYKHLGQTDLSRVEFEKALKKDQKRFSNAEFDWQRVIALKSMGETYIEMGNYVLAKEYLQKAYDLAEDGWTKMNIGSLLKKNNLVIKD